MRMQHDQAAHHHPTEVDGAVFDPVCGMSVQPVKARAAGLFIEHAGKTYFFCGKGCKLEFGDAPETYLDPSYKPSM